jgi:hypothetical protein
MKRLALLLSALLLLTVASPTTAVVNEHDRLCRLLTRWSDAYGFGIDATPTWAGTHSRSEPGASIRVRVTFADSGRTLRWTSTRPVLIVHLSSASDIEGGHYRRAFAGAEEVPTGPQALGLWCYR